MWVPWEPVQGSTESAPAAMPQKPDLSCLPTSHWEQCRNLLSAVASSRAPSGLDAPLGQRDARPCNQSRQKAPVTHRARSQLEGQRLSERDPRALGGCKRPTPRQQALPAVPGQSLWGHPASAFGHVQQSWSVLHPVSCCDTSLGHHEPLQLLSAAQAQSHRCR